MLFLLLYFHKILFSLVNASDHDPIIVHILLGPIGLGHIEPLPQNLLGLWAGRLLGDSPQWGGAQVVRHLTKGWVKP